MNLLQLEELLKPTSDPFGTRTETKHSKLARYLKLPFDITATSTYLQMSSQRRIVIVDFAAIFAGVRDFLGIHKGPLQSLVL